MQRETEVEIFVQEVLETKEYLMKNMQSNLWETQYSKIFIQHVSVAEVV